MTTSSDTTALQPTYEQVASLPAFAQMSVPTAFEDLNGHLNIRHYLGIASEGLDESLVEVGILQQWPTIAGSAVFTAEHHLTYLSELRTGDKISVRVRLLGRSARAAHVLVYLLDDEKQRVSYVMEEVFLHIDMESRRTAEWPADVAAALDERVARDADLPWEPALSGSMSLR
ncbi:thioesterase family protein [Nocardioides sp.]|uniref:thioesterase family protein n=1 Tax=Nocardioides sp. TaxID=35761 RepID=UPI002B27AD85|nr:thioesterase family protein [Nocardioides sp.]